MITLNVKQVFDDRVKQITIMMTVLSFRIATITVHFRAFSTVYCKCMHCTCVCNRIVNRSDVFHWDATALPLRDNSVDVFVTDMVR